MSFRQGPSNGMHEININCVLCSFSTNHNEEERERNTALIATKLLQFTDQLNIVFYFLCDAYTQAN